MMRGSVRSRTPPVSTRKVYTTYSQAIYFDKYTGYGDKYIPYGCLTLTCSVSKNNYKEETDSSGSTELYEEKVWHSLSIIGMKRYIYIPMLQMQIQMHIYILYI